MAIDTPELEVLNLLGRVQREGESVSALIHWQSREIGAMLLRARTGVVFLVEVGFQEEEEASRITRLRDGQILEERGRGRELATILRHEGFVEKNLARGMSTTILGLSVDRSHLDYSSQYTTPPLTSIRFLSRTQLH
ncbi:MAG TPA: hypothetical protein VLE69_00495 [Candidatus Saccharimonadales bacterium]|nr:hypothetical protein [Candidatus Saccharimonadales bacterium]